jgi:hypothetical protein
LPLYGRALIVGLFYTSQFLPYAVQYARAGLAAIPSSYEWAARVHGASAAKTTRSVVVPLLWPHCVGGAILIFSIAFRELVGSVLLRPPGMQTVSTFILREFDQGNPAAGMAMGVIAITAALLSIIIARRLVGRNPCDDCRCRKILCQEKISTCTEPTRVNARKKRASYLSFVAPVVFSEASLATPSTLLAASFATSLTLSAALSTA